MSSATSARRLARLTHSIMAGIIVAWCGLWLLKTLLDQSFESFRGATPTAVYWLTCKLLAWIAPAIGLIRMSGRDIQGTVNRRDWRRWVSWGLGVGCLIAVTGVAAKIHAGRPLLPSKFDYATLNVLLVAPLFEEFLLRAAVMENLSPSMGFLRANAAAAGYFLMLHVPGWYMAGTLGEKLRQPIGGAASIFFLGLLFGWASSRGRSFLGGSLAHGLNNLAS